MRAIGAGGLLLGLIAVLLSLGGVRGAPAAPPPTAPPPLFSPTAPAATTPGPCPPAWRIVASPNAPSGANRLSKVAVIGPDDSWTVGVYSGSTGQGPTQTLTEHWNGNTWSIVPSPNVGTGNNALSSVAGVATNDVWAVGFYSIGDGLTQTLIEHWNGTSWSVVPSPNAGTENNVLHAVAAVRADDVWAVGEYMWGGTLFEHWDGSAWRIEPTSDPLTLYGVAAAASSDVWAVGAAGPIGRTLIEHWDGSIWRIVPSPNGWTGQNVLRSVAARRPNDAWAVGSYAAETAWQTLLLHWDGSAWRIMTSPNIGTEDNWLEDVAAAAPNDVWAVGHYLNAGVWQPLILHWNGSVWAVVDSPYVGTGHTILNSVAAASANDIWATGEHGDQTLILRYSNSCGPSPTPAPTPVTCPLPFSDVAPTHPFYPYIDCLYCRNIVGGYSDNTFRPGNTVTRGQVAKFVANAAGYADAIAPARQSFTDVPPHDPFWLFIERARAHGVISGYSDGTFRPGNSVTRGQMSKFVGNAAGYADAIPPAQQSFGDVPPSDPFRLYIERAYAHGIVSGYNCGGPGEPCPGFYFRPFATLTRGQAAKFISNAFFPGCGPLR
jgi:S-layer homology domain